MLFNVTLRLPCGSLTITMIWERVRWRVTCREFLNQTLHKCVHTIYYFTFFQYKTHMHVLWTKMTFNVNYSIFIYLSTTCAYFLHTHTYKSGHKSDIRGFGCIRDPICFVRIISYPIWFVAIHIYSVPEKLDF